ncbi:UNVERIFIED_CONTAM: hypothetical protein FKN15_023315 [Acipenser sinensis]
MDSKLHKDKPLRTNLILQPDSHSGCHRVMGWLAVRSCDGRVDDSREAPGSCRPAALHDDWPIDLNQPIAAQGPFDVIIHKLSDVMGEAEHDSQSQQLLEQFEGYTAGHPHTVLLDPLPAMRRLLDRFASYRIMEGLQTAIPGEWICSPPYMEISSTELSEKQLDRAQRSLPFPIKNLIITKNTKNKRLLTKYRGSDHNVSLETGCPEPSGDPERSDCGTRDTVERLRVRPCERYRELRERYSLSLADRIEGFLLQSQEEKLQLCFVFADRKTIFFNSHDVSKPESSSHLTALEEEAALPHPPCDDVIAAIVTKLRSELGMSLFGVDVIVNTETGRHTVIDINIFPGYEGVPQFFSALLNHIEALLQEKGGACETRGSPDHPAKGGEVEVGASAVPPSTSTLIDGVSRTAAQRNIH